MRSLKVREVVIKNPRLRNFRDNLRKILKLTVLDKIKSSDQHYERDKLRRLLSQSTCMCSLSTCISEEQLLTEPKLKSAELDMVWVPWLESWICVECYDAHYKNMTLEQFIEIAADDPVAIDERCLKYLKIKYQNSFENH